MWPVLQSVLKAAAAKPHSITISLSDWQFPHNCNELLEHSHKLCSLSLGWRPAGSFYGTAEICFTVLQQKKKKEELPTQVPGSLSLFDVLTCLHSLCVRVCVCALSFALSISHSLCAHTPIGLGSIGCLFPMLLARDYITVGRVCG